MMRLCNTIAQKFCVIKKIFFNSKKLDFLRSSKKNTNDSFEVCLFFFKKAFREFCKKICFDLK